MKRYGMAEHGTLRELVSKLGSRAEARELERLEKQAELGRTYLKELRRDVRCLMFTAEESFDGALIGKMTEKLDEAELKELQRVYGKKSAQVMGVQLCYGGEERSAGDESDFRV